MRIDKNSSSLFGTFFALAVKVLKFLSNNEGYYDQQRIYII
jgi:hypothetical protein